MAATAYEYKMLVEYVSPEQKGKYPHLALSGDQEGLTAVLENVCKRLPDFVPQGWEINSHSIAVWRDTLIVTLLLRRPLSSSKDKKAQA